jgi:ABC-type metal ion transport system substrate-binding protein
MPQSAVQRALRILKRRGLIKVAKASATALSEYKLVRNWLRRRAKERRTV